MNLQRERTAEERILVKATYETNGSWKENVYYISQSFVKVKNASGTYDFKYIYQNGQLIAQELVGGQKNFMLNDHKGSVQVVVNESGAKVEETFYSPFGEIISGGATSRFDYEGKEFDSVVGDYDYHARKYCPGSGRFCQPDTMLPNVYDPQQLNRYAFERNNPFKYTDEDGNNPVLALAGVGAIIGLTTYFLTHEDYTLRGALSYSAAGAVSSVSGFFGLGSSFIGGIASQAIMNFGDQRPLGEDNFKSGLISALTFGIAKTVTPLPKYWLIKNPSSYLTTETGQAFLMDSFAQESTNNLINRISNSNLMADKNNRDKSKFSSSSSSNRAKEMRSIAEKGVKEKKTAGEVIKSWRAKGLSK